MGTSNFSPSDTARAYPIAAIAEYIAAFVPYSARSDAYQHHIPSHDERGRGTNLIEQNSERGLEDEINSLEREVPLDDCAFKERRRVFEREGEYGHEHRYDLDQGDRHDHGDDGVIARVRTGDEYRSWSVRSG